MSEQKTAFRLNKRQLNDLSTLLGIIGGISLVLATNGYMDAKLAATINGVSTVLLGYMVQKPASEHPTTQELEQQKLSEQ